MSTLSGYQLSYRFPTPSDDNPSCTAQNGSLTIHPMWTFSQSSNTSPDLNKSPHPASPAFKERNQLNPSTETSFTADEQDESLPLKSPMPLQNAVRTPSPDEIMSFADRDVPERMPSPAVSFGDRDGTERMLTTVEEDNHQNTAIRKSLDVYESMDVDEEEENIDADKSLPVEVPKGSSSNQKLASAAYEDLNGPWQYMTGDFVYIQAKLPKVNGRPFWLKAQILRKVFKGETAFYWVEFVDRYVDYRPNAKWMSGDKLWLDIWHRVRTMVNRDNAHFQREVNLAKSVGKPVQSCQPGDTTV